MILFRYLLPAVLGCMLPLSSLAQSQSQIDSLATHFRDQYRLPGLAMAVIRPDTFFLGVSGRRAVNQETLIQTTDLFHIGSNTKAFTSFLAAKLVEEAKIKWQDTLGQLVPELTDDIHPAYRSVNLQDLLSHRARMAPFESTGTREFRALPHPMPSGRAARLAFVRAALSLPPRDMPKAGLLYSNGGYIVGALMLEQATGSTYEQLVEEMGKELGLQLSFGFPQAEDNAVVLGHRRRALAFLSRKKYKAMAPDNSFAVPPYFAPAGDLSLSLTDLARWVQLHLQGLLGEDNYLRATTYEKLHFGLADYALGWYNGKIGEGPERFSYHGGSLGTFSSAIMLSPDRQIGIMILINAESKAVQKAKQEIRVDLWNRYAKANKHNGIVH